MTSKELSRPVGVIFQRDTIRRVGNHGDNWCITWAADGSQITSMDDGAWIEEQRRSYHNHLYRIVGDPADFSPQDVPGYPQFCYGDGGWFGYGIISVEGAIYASISKTPGKAWSGPFPGVKLLKSIDNGQSWCRVDRQGNERALTPTDPASHETDATEMFFWREYGQPHVEQMAYPFSYWAFVQRGQDNRAAQDDFVYIYSPEGAHTHQLMLARAPKERLGLRDAWRYLAGYDGDKPLWSADIGDRQPAHVFPATSQDGNYFGWYSWLPSVVWNEGLGLYIMVNGGTYGGHGMTNVDEDYGHSWMHTRTGSLGFWYSDKPYGPWHEIYYTDYWTADDPANLTYQPKLSPKWISDDGRQMLPIWSDAMKNEAGKSHTIGYKRNQMAISIEIA